MRTLLAALLVLGMGAFASGCKKRSQPTPDEGVQEPAGPAVTLPTVGGDRGALPAGKATAVTAPVDATGHIDYAAALNERMKIGRAHV